MWYDKFGDSLSVSVDYDFKIYVMTWFWFTVNVYWYEVVSLFERDVIILLVWNQQNSNTVISCYGGKKGEAGVAPGFIQQGGPATQRGQVAKRILNAKFLKIWKI